MLSVDYDQVLDRIMGGDREEFVKNVWRKETRYFPDCISELNGFYSIDSFYKDYREFNYHESSLIIDVAEGKRRTSVPRSMDCIERARKDNCSMVLQSIKIPENYKELPKHWSWFRSLYRELCGFLLPDMPSDYDRFGAVTAIDFFVADDKASIGGHYDTGDVFYFVLEGEKEWTVEIEPDFSFSSSLASESELTLGDFESIRPRKVLKIKPGDALYVPPYTYHRVKSEKSSLAVSIGLPTFNEITYLRHLLEKIKFREGLLQPFPSYPEINENALNSKSEIRDRISAAMEKLDDEVCKAF